MSDFESLTDDELRARLKLRVGPACPQCGCARVVPFMWGMPGDPAFGEASKRGLVVLGGCLVRGDWSDPAWCCRDCRHEFGTMREVLDEGPDDYAPVTFVAPGDPDPETGLERLERVVAEDEASEEQS